MSAYLWIHTFCKEDTDSKTEGDSGHRVAHEKEENNERVCLIHNSAFSWVKFHTVKQSHDSHRDEHEENVFGEPGRPMQPVGDAHHLHRFLEITSDSPQWDVSDFFLYTCIIMFWNA